jgi:hypothetical protein
MDDLSTKVSSHSDVKYTESIRSQENMDSVDKMLSELLAEVDAIEEAREEEVLK